MKIKSRKPLPVSATLRPGDFPPGSPESGAVVRMKLLKIRKAQSRVTVVLHMPRPHVDPRRYDFTGWSGDAVTGFRRFCLRPANG